MALVCALLASPAQSQPVGEVEFSRGVGFAQGTGQSPRTLGKGLPVNEGDRLTTSDGASAIVKLQDGTRMTVRPNSEMLIQQYKFREAAATDNNMVLQLLRGGFRAITGLISKNSPNAARVVTKTATIGIRGTDFDARLCSGECQSESAKVAERPKPNAVQASAKVVTALGDVVAVDAAGARRKLFVGGSVYAGDVVETDATSNAVLAFRDDSRVTVGARTRFRVDSFVFDEKNPRDGRFLVSLLRGSLRALTGLIAKANTRNVGFTTKTATIGIRGTGLDLDCNEESGSEDACRFYTWLGAIEVTPKGQSTYQLLQAGQGLFVGANGVTRPLQSPTLQDLQRPDTAAVDARQLFSSAPVDDAQDGLFVYVRDGHIEVSSATQTLHLGKGETGFAAVTGATIRPTATPLFLEFDRTPMPDSKNPLLSSVLNEAVGRPLNRCR